MLRNKEKPVMWHVRQAVAIEKDSRQRKKAIIIAQAITFVAAFSLAVVYLLRHADVLTAENHRDQIKAGYGFETTPPGEALVYDQMCLELGQNKESGEYLELYDVIASLSRDFDDIKKGT